MLSNRVDNKEAARMLGIRPSTLATWRSSGKGPRYKKIGRKVYYNVSDIDEFIESSNIETNDSIDFRR